jgi:putative transposase
VGVNGKRKKALGVIPSRQKAKFRIEEISRGLILRRILKGRQDYYDYFREHEGLGNITPAEAAGIKIEGTNKWVTVIQNASQDAN